jgi:hypothetical protein
MDSDPVDDLDRLRAASKRARDIADEADLLRRCPLIEVRAGADMIWSLAFDMRDELDDEITRRETR